MSRLKELIDELCPDGVEFKSLGEICVITRGVRVTKKDLLPNGKYPVVSGGTGFMGYLDEYNREAGTITIAQYGTAGYVNWQLQKFWANDVCFSVIPDEKIIQNKYLYYFLTNNQKYLYSISNRDAIPYSIDRERILKIKVPVPPMEIQREIVRILDNFSEKSTELCELLSAELVARKKQYEYYSLKIFERLNAHTEMVTISSLGKWSGGKTPSMANKDFWNDGTIPWISSKDMKTSIFEDTQDHITDKALDEARMTLFPEGIVAIVTRSGILKHTLPIAFVPFRTTINQDIKALVVKEGVLPKYAFHVLKAYANDIRIKAKKQGGTVDSLDIQKVMNFKIPLPPLPEQKRIADILDRLDSRYAELSVSIPAEIAARKKQYEYYRDRLLTFREKV